MKQFWKVIKRYVGPYTGYLGGSVLLNILSADTHVIGGKTYGSMVLGLPPDETEAARALLYLREIPGLTAEEVTDYVS